MQNTMTTIDKYLSEISESEKNITLSKDGRWYFSNERVLDETIIEYLFENLVSTNEVSYINTSEKKIPIQVEETTIFITDLEFTGAGNFEKIKLHSTMGIHILDIATIRMSEDDHSLYCKIGQNKDEAKFMRTPLIKIIERLIEGENDQYYLRLCGTIIKL